MNETERMLDAMLTEMERRLGIVSPTQVWLEAQYLTTDERGRGPSRPQKPYSQERQDIHTAYNAMLDLEMIPRGPVRVRSRVGMVALLESIFANVPPNTKTRTYPQRRKAEKVKVRWSWPPEACARAHRARPLMGAV